MAKELLIDSTAFNTVSLHESKSDPNKIIMRGQFARSDKATENKRLYRESLWRREIGRLNEAMQNRSMYGELDHPSDGRTKLARVSHLVTSLNVHGNEVIGEAEIMDTPNGRILKALAAANAKVGVSSRGYGSTKTLPDGTQEVQEDFRLDTFDFVADPATKTAYPEVVSEERETVHMAEQEMTLDILRDKYPGLIAEAASSCTRASSGVPMSALSESEARVRQEMTESFSVELRRAMERMEPEIRAQVRSEMMSDPNVAGAAQVVEQIVGLVKSYGLDPSASEELMGKDDNISQLERQIEDKTLEVHKLNREMQEKDDLLRKVSYRLKFEQLVGGDPSRAAIEALIGDVTKFESLDDIETRVAAVRSELDKRGALRSEDDEKVNKIKSELDAARARVSELEKQVSEAEDGKRAAESESENARKVAMDALEHAENLEARLHVEQVITSRIGNLTEEDAGSIRSLTESASSIEEANKIIEAYKPSGRTKDSDEVSRIHEAVARGKNHDLLEEEGRPAVRGGKKSSGGSRLVEDAIGLGQEEFDRLAGSGSGKA